MSGERQSSSEVARRTRGGRDVVSEFYLCLGQVTALAHFKEVQEWLEAKGGNVQQLRDALHNAAATAYVEGGR